MKQGCKHTFVQQYPRGHHLQEPEGEHSPGLHQQINTMWYIHVTEYYPALKRDEVLIELQGGCNLKALREVK